MSQSKTLINKIYDIEKKSFHYNLLKKGVRGKELHHATGRVGVRKCCPLMFVAGNKGHHDSIEWIKSIREKFSDIEKEAVGNFKKVGCLKEINEACMKCAMPKINGG
jgi:hypothetical protein